MAQQNTSTAQPTPAPSPSEMSGGVPNISESPVIQSPVHKESTPGPKKTFTLSKQTKYLLAGLSVVAILLIGVGASYFLTQESQDTRQQASVPTGTANIIIQPGNSTIEGGKNQISTMQLRGNSSTQSIGSVQFTALITGQIPTDIQFLASDIPGMLPAEVNFSNDSSGGKLLAVRFELQSSQGVSLSSQGIELGQISFTAPNTGQLSIQFVAASSSVLSTSTNSDILQPPSEIIYTFTPSNETEVVADSDVDASDEASVASNSARLLNETEESTDSSLLAQGFTLTPTQTPTRTPTRTPTKSPTPTPSASGGHTTLTATPTLLISATPTPTSSSRESSLPVETQEQPVSGSATQTLVLFLTGISSIGYGIYNWRNHQIKKHT